ncbi:hypothetical protein EII10_08290 [Actinomyces bowdenii]|uniref:Uncharacterized protein n=1 Tax=Actinomyces bowdenii TaxID=131109 RepID=A0A3P1V5B5_9ACTO|nr:hypothetical protein EII10_08290 [Actinomyces bowdenii]
MTHTPGTRRPATASVIGTRGGLDSGASQHLADRLDPEVLSVVVDEGVDDLYRRSSSAWAK